MFCLTLNPQHLNLIENLEYLPVGLGDSNFNNKFMQDKIGKNISFKNSFYGEYTFHYWLWNNYLDEIDTEWVGFCQYRKFFIKKELNEKNLSLELLKENLIKDITDELNEFDCILGKPFSVNQLKLTKFIKRNFLKLIKNPSVIYSSKKRNIKFHFDIFHGEGHLDEAIKLLDNENKNDFKDFVNLNTSFNPHNMFMCKKKYLEKYYSSVFPWLKKCEKKFGFENLKGYGMKRIYGFLAERYLSYWFQKNSRVKEYPIVVKDLLDLDYKNF